MLQQLDNSAAVFLPTGSCARRYERSSAVAVPEASLNTGPEEKVYREALYVHRVCVRVFKSTSGHDPMGSEH